MATMTSPTGESRLRFKGLKPEEVLASRQKHGANILTPPPRDPWWKLFLEKFDDPVIRILLIAAFIAIVAGAAHGEYIEGVGIIIAILLATILAFWNEMSAAKEFDVLNKQNDRVPVNVIRGGTFASIGKDEVVVGDVVQVEVGEEVPADGEILEAVSLQLDEASLTGESEPVTKQPKDAPVKPGKAEPAYPPYFALRSCFVRDGHGLMEVTAVGDGTVIGKTARASVEETGEETPLNQQLERLSKVIGVVGFGVAALVFAALVVRGAYTGELALARSQWAFAAVLGVAVMVALVRVWLPVLYDGLEVAGQEADPPEWLEAEGFGGWLKAAALGALLFGLGLGALLLLSKLDWSDVWLPQEASSQILNFFMIAVTIIVVAVPEGLAMSVTLSLAYSMKRMQATNNLVRKMHACETIGAATVICSDKTGTLTQNDMRVFEVQFPSLQGQPLAKGSSSLGPKLIVEAMAANSTAQLSREGGTPTPLGNVTEGALLLWLDSAGIDYVAPRTDFPVTYQWTFSTERKYMATLGTSIATGKPILHVKGAPETVLQRCTQILTPEGQRALSDADRKQIEEALVSYQARAMRTLGFAYHDEPAAKEEGVDPAELTQGLVWLGFAAIADPIRPEVPPAIQACRKAGVLIKMVTGDNAQTAREIGRQINLWEPSDPETMHLSGPEFTDLSDEEATRRGRELKILSRARPENKKRLVVLLRASGHVVAVTGDGVNDGPALNHANVGLAMGKKGTAVAKEASDIILLDDSFKSIVNAIMWGRCLYQNIQRFILFQLTINVVALGVALLGPFIGVKLPLTVTQMLWVNLIMDTFAALALASEPPHWDVMNGPPRNPSHFIVTPAMGRNIAATGLLFLAFMIAFLLKIQDDGVVTPYELSLFFTTFVMIQFWNLFNARCLGLTQSALAGLFSNRGFVGIAAVIFVGQILMTQFGGDIFRTEPLALKDWLIIVGGSSIVLWAGELWRFVQRSRAPRVEAAPAAA